MSRFTPVKLLPLILSTLLLTSCSGPDSSGGVEFSKTANEFPYGDCRGPGYRTYSTKETGCGYFVSQNANPETSHYIMPWADLIGANLSGANLSNANLSYTTLSYAKLTNARLFGANLTGADLTYANLSGANLSNANLTYAFPSFANLSRANLSYANLFGAYLVAANLSRANLMYANLTGVKPDSSTICPNGKPWGGSGNCPF